MTALEVRVRRSTRTGLIRLPEPVRPPPTLKPKQKPKAQVKVTPAACGTYGGYQTHIRRRETPCDDCRRANRQYTRNLRYREGKGTPRHRALQRLMAGHRDEFRVLVREEQARDGDA